jgi:peptide subunit release factor 1 (eRF1)
MLTSRNYKLNREKTLALLGDLETSDDKAISLYFPAGISELGIEMVIGKARLTQTIPTDVIRFAGNSPTGSVIFWGESHKHLLIPPFPLKEQYIANGYDVDTLRSLLSQDFKIGIVLVRLGSYSIGTCQGEVLIEHNTGTGLVHGRHRQGGSSAARFQRRRKDQSHHFLERVCEHIREKFTPQVKTLDYFVYGGARTTILQLQKQCPFLEQFNDRLLPPLLDIPDPKYLVLERAVKDIWSSKITKWREQDIGKPQ